MTAARWTFSRQVDETYPEILTVTVTAEQLATLGVYDDAEAAATGLAAADVRLVVDALEVSLVATVTAVVTDGDVVMTLSWAPPSSMTDTVQRHACQVVHEPGSPTSERVLADGLWVVTAREADA